MKIRQTQKSLSKLKLSIHPQARQAYELHQQSPRLPQGPSILHPTVLELRQKAQAIEAVIKNNNVLVIGQFHLLATLPSTGSIKIRQYEDITNDQIREHAITQVIENMSMVVDGNRALGYLYEAWQNIPPDLCNKLTGHNRVSMKMLAVSAGLPVRKVRHQVDRLRAERKPLPNILSEITK